MNQALRGSVLGASGSNRPATGKREANLRISVCAMVFLSVLVFSAAARAQGPVPLVGDPLIPPSAAPGTPGLTLTVNGVNFTSNSIVNWNGSPLATTVISGNQLTAVVPASSLAKPSTAAVTVTNPGVAASNIAFFPVNSAENVSGTIRSDMNAGSNPTGVAIADFNGDGILDMAISNDNDSTVAVYFGNGDGTFQTPTIYPVGDYPYNVVVGDVNNDGIPDLITDNLYTQDISVLLGNGDGTFQPAVDYPTGDNPQSIVLGDFNGDGKLDVATPNYLQGSVAVLLGNGDGTFRPYVNYPVGHKPIDVKTADVNGDGHLDLIVANNADDTVSVLFGNGDGTFQKQHVYRTGARPNAIGVGDLNGDGFPDLVTSNGGATLSVLLNAGDGTYLPQKQYRSGSYPSYVVQIVDMNDDNHVDVVVPNFNCFQVDIYYGNGDGTLNPKPSIHTVDAQVDAMGIADFNNDGRLDIIALNEFANEATILLQSTTPPPSLSTSVVLFGNVDVGKKSGAQTVTLVNTTGSALSVSGLKLAGAESQGFHRLLQLPALPEARRGMHPDRLFRSQVRGKVRRQSGHQRFPRHPGRLSGRHRRQVARAG